jgi:hypothetical protein
LVILLGADHPIRQACEFAHHSSLKTNIIDDAETLQPGLLSLELFHQEGVQPDPVTYIGVLNACASIVALEERRCVNEQLIKAFVN